METDRRIEKIIEGAEKALAALAAEAASARDYARAGSLLAIAQRVADAAKPAHVLHQLPVLTQAQPNRPAPAQNHRSTLDAVAVDFGAAAPPAGRPTTSSQYPRFKREEDTLVKIGWSKSDKATYEHRSPRSVLDILVRRIQEVGGNGLRFTTDQVLPLSDEQGAELPSYQCYLCLAWLVAGEMVNRHGRQGYTVREPGDLPQSVEAAWQALPRR